MEEQKKREIIYKVIRAVGTPIVRFIFNYSYDSIDGAEGPFLLLANHTTDADSAFLGLASKRQVYFVATENLTRMPHFGKLLMKLFDPIIHYKGTVGVRTARIILRHLRKGHNVAMFPEGNRTFNGLTCPIPKATGELARVSGATLVTYRIKGGYFTSPRWHKKSRKGRIKGELVGIYTHEQLMAMTPEEVDKVIERDLFVDAYAEQEKDPVRFKGKDLAECLESTLFLCPSCGQVGHLHSKGDLLYCDCGYEATYDEYGYLNEKDGTVRKVTDLDVAQRKYIEDYPKDSSDEEIFCDSISEEIVDENHEVTEVKDVTFKAFPDRFTVSGKKILFDDIEAIAVNQRNLLLIHLRGQKALYQYRGPIYFNALKYLYLFRSVKGSVSGVL